MTKTPMNNRGLHTGNTVRRSGEDDEDDHDDDERDDDQDDD